MIEVKSPWDSNLIDSVETHGSEEIEKIISNASKVAKAKGIDFPPKDIKVLKSFCEIVKENIDNLAELATSEGGKPITDSVIEIKRVLRVESYRGLKSDCGSVIPMNINGFINRIASKRTLRTGISNKCV